MNTPLTHFKFDHARGVIHGCHSPAGLCRLSLPHENKSQLSVTEVPPNVSLSPLAAQVVAALEAYFGGAPELLEAVPLDLSPGTPFQQRVWLGARETPFGMTETYGGLTRKLGLPMTSARAVGRALGANPIAIAVPCHRFIAANGDLVNFAAGLAWKRDLLQHEGAVLC